jgi:hypothetical protein
MFLQIILCYQSLPPKTNFVKRFLNNIFQCFGSGSALNPHSVAPWIYNRRRISRRTICSRVVVRDRRRKGEVALDVSATK